MAKKVKRTELAWGIWSDDFGFYLEFSATRAGARFFIKARGLAESGCRVIRVRITEVR